MSATQVPASFSNTGTTSVASVPKISNRWKKSTKQVATLGPASSTKEMIEKLFLNGADVFRLNFSHGAQEQKLDLLRIIREIEDQYSHPISILGDLQGPKLRVGEFSSDSGVILEDGQTFRLDLDSASGDANRVQLPHPEIIEASEIGHILLVDDGKLRLSVTGKGNGYLDCLVEVGGKISNRKGVNTPDSILEISPLTEKDKSDLNYMLKIGVDWVALSFVQRPSDIKEINKLIDENLPEGMFRPSVMAKIEKPSCFFGSNLDDIIKASDGIMVARGDLGVECAPEDVPILQKQIIDTSRRFGKPVVVATQMLESMIDVPTPTRAEASDVATAIFDGADAIMLSAESAAGKYPEASVAMQQRIINRVENDPHYVRYLNQLNIEQDKSDASEAITLAAKNIARTIDAKAIVVFTCRGSTAIRSSRSRPGIPIVAISPFRETARQLALCWGVYPDLPKAGSYGYDLKEDNYMYADADDFDDDLEREDVGYVEEAIEDFDLILRNACRAVLKKGLVNNPNDLLVVTAGMPFGTPGAANVIRIIPAAGPSCWDGLCRA